MIEDYLKMALPRAFLSFEFDHDLTSKILFAGQSKEDSPTPFGVQDWSSKASLPQTEWERLIKAKINTCHMLIVLVGKNMTTAGGVAKEIRMARDLNVPYFGVYVNGAEASSILPTGLSRNAVAAWNWNRIAIMVDQYAALGKNSRTVGWAGL